MKVAALVKAYAQGDTTVASDSEASEAFDAGDVTAADVNSEAIANPDDGISGSEGNRHKRNQPKKKRMGQYARKEMTKTAAGPSNA